MTGWTALAGCCPSIKDRFSAAFHDPRFPPVQAEEVQDIGIEISVLSTMEPIPVLSRQAVLAQLKPRVDGLLLRKGQYHATFLPTVWTQLPEPEQFLGHLLVKAGLPPDYWSAELELFRYRTLSFAEHPPPEDAEPLY